MIVYVLHTPMGVTTPIIEYGDVNAIISNWQAKGFQVEILRSEQ